MASLLEGDCMDFSATQTCKTRAKAVFSSAAPLLFLGMAHCLLFFLTGHGIPCLFRLLTGLKCPGCGMTHALFAILRGDVRGAASENLLSILLLPPLGLYLLYRFCLYVGGLRQALKAWELVFLLLCFCLCLAYGIYRNLVW